MHYNLEMPYSFFSGHRDLGPDHVKAILAWAEKCRLIINNQDTHVYDYYAWLDDESDRLAEEEREEEEARAYLRQKPIMLTDDKED